VIVNVLFVLVQIVINVLLVVLVLKFQELHVYGMTQNVLVENILILDLLHVKLVINFVLYAQELFLLNVVLAVIIINLVQVLVFGVQLVVLQEHMLMLLIQFVKHVIKLVLLVKDQGQLIVINVVQDIIQKEHRLVYLVQQAVKFVHKMDLVLNVTVNIFLIHNQKLVNNLVEEINMVMQ